MPIHPVDGPPSLQSRRSWPRVAQGRPRYVDVESLSVGTREGAASRDTRTPMSSLLEEPLGLRVRGYLVDRNRFGREFHRIRRVLRRPNNVLDPVLEGDLVEAGLALLEPSVPLPSDDAHMIVY